MRLHLPVSTLVLLLLLINAAAYGSSPWASSTNSYDVVRKRGWRKYLPFAAKRPATPTPASSWDTTTSSDHSPHRSPPRAQDPVVSPPASPSPPRGRSPTSPLLLSPPRRASPSGRVSPPPGFSQLWIPHSFRSRSSSSTSGSTPPRATWHIGESSTAPSAKRKGLWASIKDTLGGKRRKKD